MNGAWRWYSIRLPESLCEPILAPYPIISDSGQLYISMQAAWPVWRQPPFSPDYPVLPIANGMIKRVLELLLLRCWIFNSSVRNVRALEGYGKVVAGVALNQVDVGFSAIFEGLKVEVGIVVGIDEDPDGHSDFFLGGRGVVLGSPDAYVGLLSSQ